MVPIAGLYEELGMYVSDWTILASLMAQSDVPSRAKKKAVPNFETWWGSSWKE